ncbi:hypothetical protein Ancab_000774 [Ancistrocladus abbreviatus]
MIHSHATCTLQYLSILSLLLSSEYTKAQQPDPSSHASNPAPLEGVIFTAFTVIVLLILLLYFFIRNAPFLHRSSTWPSAAVIFSFHHPVPPLSPPRGVSQSLLETFPLFEYSEVKAGLKGVQQLECPVCLSAFEGENEKLRLLPKCNHVFHLQCVDPWLAYHATCPYCRANLLTEFSESTQPANVPIQNESGDAGAQNDVVIMTMDDDLHEAGNSVTFGSCNESRPWKSTGNMAEVQREEEALELQANVRGE